ncbi:hypothetical protein GCM10009808_13210 [Microbacterium sediminicola]|uniref:Transcriptional regulator n=1 Tax=Microbacterium sediminicola TaxID=415210 RepID=A0ABN2I1Q1_9MICO
MTPAPTAAQSDQDRIAAKLDARYGRTRTTRSRWLAGVGIAIVAVVVVWFGWMTVASSMNTVTADATGFTVDSAHAVTVSFRATVTPGSEIACALEAQDEEHGVVGWKIVVIPPSEEHTRAFVESIPTIAEATTGLVNSCWVT